MFELKHLSKEGIPKALERADRYRLLNEPVEAESICRDVLAIEPENQLALVTLLLGLTDQLEEDFAEAARQAREVVPRLKDEYARAYYAGIVFERRAKAQLKRGGPGAAYVAHDLFQEAMSCYLKAEALRPPGNEDALLRWNTCARILMRHPQIRPGPQERVEAPLE
jgi:tetratricopeptide (TPR) repeat protein